MTDEEKQAALDAHTQRLNEIAQRPRISEDAWEVLFNWLPSGDGVCEMLGDTPGMHALLAQRDPHYVWTEIDAQDDSGGYWLLPGYYRGVGHGWYLCGFPWHDGHQVIGVIDAPDEPEDAA